MRVAQELKNNQDFMNQTNQKLNSLSDGLIALTITHDKAIGNGGSNHKALEIQFQNLKEFIDKSLIRIHKRLDEVEIKTNKVLEEFSDLRNEVEDEYITTKIYDVDFHNLIISIDQIKKDILTKQDYFNISLNTIKSMLRQEIEKTKEELKPKVLDIDPVNQKITERLGPFRVDYEGLKREIELLKSAVSYDQKKFENIYTLIERLKGIKP